MLDAADLGDGHAYSWPTIKLPPRAPVMIGRSPDCQAFLDHSSISPTHAVVTREKGKLKIEDLGSRYGTRVNGHPIRLTVLEPDDIVFFGGSPPYRFDGKRLKIDLDAQGMAITLRNIGITRNGRELLKNANAQISPGEFVGVLGPSGGGKSLLLGCLSDTIVPDEGGVIFDFKSNIEDNRNYYRSKLGFVPQEDLIYESLTVEENLKFAVDIRLPDADDDEKQARMDNAIDSVDLGRHREKICRALSGGQKKRVSVAIELLTRPRLLLLDEPTSGLDPGTQFHLMDTLRQLSRRGLTIICVTHSMESLHFFDSLLVLGFRNKVSTLVYHDAPDKILAAFGVHTLPDLFDALQGGVQVDAVRNDGRHRANTLKKARVRTVIRDERRRSMPQAAVIFRRTALCFVRDLGGCGISLGLPLILAIIIVFTQYRQPDSAFASFFLAVSALWLGMALSVREIVKERKLFLRDRLGGMSPMGFVLGKAAFLLAVSLIQSVVLYAVSRLYFSVLTQGGFINQGGFKNPYPLACFVVIALLELGGILLGLIVSTVSSTEQMAVSALPLLLLPQVFLSRVATYAMYSWDDPRSPFVMIARLGQAIGDGGESFLGSLRDMLLFIFSLPLFTRWGTAALDLFSKSVASRTDWFGGAVLETIVLLLLVGGFAASFVAIFMTCEKRWTLR